MKKTREERKAELQAMSRSRRFDNEFMEAYRLASDTLDEGRMIPIGMRDSAVIEQILDKEFPDPQGSPAAR